jgi:hypothetical protein
VKKKRKKTKPGIGATHQLTIKEGKAKRRR